MTDSAVKSTVGHLFIVRVYLVKYAFALSL